LNSRLSKFRSNSEDADEVLAIFDEANIAAVGTS